MDDCCSTGLIMVSSCCLDRCSNSFRLAAEGRQFGPAASQLPDTVDPQDFEPNVHDRDVLPSRRGRLEQDQGLALMRLKSFCRLHRTIPHVFVGREASIKAASHSLPRDKDRGA
jgi:hypothetical protein